MNEYETEEQQIAALKGWWKANGSSLIVGILVGVSALFGWRYYDEQSNLNAIYASDLYMQVMQQALSNNVNDEVIDLQNQLINDFSKTPYAALSALVLAKTEYEKGNVEEAVAQLELAIKHANDDITKQIASLRLASVFLEQQKYDEAMALLNMQHDAAFDAQFEELKGDVYSAMGKIAQARIAYDSAIQSQGIAASKWLKLKRQNLGQQKAVQEAVENISFHFEVNDYQTRTVKL